VLPPGVVLEPPRVAALGVVVSLSLVPEGAACVVPEGLGVLGPSVVLLPPPVIEKWQQAIAGVRRRQTPKQ
jgi:hypothetical protein